MVLVLAMGRVKGIFALSENSSRDWSRNWPSGEQEKWSFFSPFSRRGSGAFRAGGPKPMVLQGRQAPEKRWISYPDLYERRPCQAVRHPWFHSACMRDESLTCQPRVGMPTSGIAIAKEKCASAAQNMAAPHSKCAEGGRANLARGDPAPWAGHPGSQNLIFLRTKKNCPRPQGDLFRRRWMLKFQGEDEGDF